MDDRIHIAHLINPVRFPVDSDLTHAQPLTFESMRRAARGGRGPRRFAVQFRRSRDHPPFFTQTRDLERSVADVHKFSVNRKLPLIGDLVERLYTESTAPYLIYTNVDIILHPSFYREVAARIRTGLDAFIINRRRVGSLPDSGTTA
jgi:hypothetical protein